LTQSRKHIYWISRVSYFKSYTEIFLQQNFFRKNGQKLFGSKGDIRMYHLWPWMVSLRSDQGHINFFKQITMFLIPESNN